jgi:hypothetical protein
MKVVAADGLSKRDVFRLPDPFAVITVDAEQTHTTSVIKKTLNPYWNESFDMFVPVHFFVGFFANWRISARLKIRPSSRCRSLISVNSRDGTKDFWVSLTFMSMMFSIWGLVVMVRTKWFASLDSGSSPLLS